MVQSIPSFDRQVRTLPSSYPSATIVVESLATACTDPGLRPRKVQCQFSPSVETNTMARLYGRNSPPRRKPVWVDVTALNTTAPKCRSTSCQLMPSDEIQTESLSP